ncbi:MAG: SsrA-binding protein SmpB [Candidatus Omnitrophica bacterium]|nr:SsrA-binding protein SmpB [Candidatus Omnitrophota bacterium]
MSKPITTNRKAHRDYHILESIECGIELKGSEVKSLRDGKMNLDDSFARIDPQGVTLYNSHISPYAQASYLNVDPERPRRLLLHHSQIERLLGNSTQKGLTLIPLKAYFNDRGLAKIELALCKGKRLYDKRQDLRRRDADLEIRRALKGKRR